MAAQGNQMFSSLVGAVTSAKEKWDASGANEAVGRMAERLPAGTREYISMTSSQLFDRQKLRGLTVLFGIGEERPFYVEKSPTLLLARVKHNLTFFYLNYTVLTVILFCLTLLISPSAIIGLALLGAAWMYIIRHTQSSGNLIVYGIVISPNTATIGMTIISALVLMWLLSGIFWWTLFSSGFMVVVHAGLRDASMHQDGDDQMDMVGDVGESSAFLGNDGMNPTPVAMATPV